MKKLFLPTLAVLMFLLLGCESVPPGADVKITTSYGSIYIDLYEDTPRHRENFLQLAKEGYYDGTSFHRIVNSYIIQGGDPNTKEGATGQAGNGGPGWRIPREIVPGKFHKRGALAMARQPDQINPQWESSGSQFYIVQGRKYSDEEIQAIREQLPVMIDQHARYVYESNPKNNWTRSINFEELMVQYPDSAQRLMQRVESAYQQVRKTFPTYELTDEMYETYQKEGGAPTLDGMYTVFGEVVGGMEVVDAIGNSKTNGEVPLNHIPMEITVL